MSVPIDIVLRVLRRYPTGVTTKMLAAELGMDPRALASKLGKIWMWGGPVDREFGPRINNHMSQSIWRPR